jgi:hypothetical protein
MNDDGDQWEVYEPFASGSVTGTWNQSRNTAAIGPDGEVYAARFTTMWDFFEPQLMKTSPGYLAGFSVAGVPALGEAAAPNPWIPFMFSTTHFRIRIVGATAYVLAMLFPNEIDADTGAYSGDYGEGWYMFKLDYTDCFVPHIYRLVIR